VIYNGSRLKEESVYLKAMLQRKTAMRIVQYQRNEYN